MQVRNESAKRVKPGLLFKKENGEWEVERRAATAVVLKTSVEAGDASNN